VEDAVAQALQRLGRSADEVDVEVLHAGSPGKLLGFGAELARVRVAVRAGVRSGERAAPAAVVTAPALEREEEIAAAEADAERQESDAEAARIMLQELLIRMGLDLEVDIQQLSPLTLNVQGEDVADLIGRRGEHLRALQFLLSLMVNRQLGRRIRLIVDVDGYRIRREELLRNMAVRLAQRVRMTHQPLPLEAMPPNERRVIHLALADDPDVMTESIGDGDDRRVVIKPRR
jgi:spoIIIJ-associated protein